MHPVVVSVVVEHKSVEPAPEVTTVRIRTKFALHSVL